MRVYTPSPAVDAFYQHLIALSRQQSYSYFTVYWPRIVVPATPSEPEDRAFFEHVCLPLYDQLVQAYRQWGTVPAPPASSDSSFSSPP